MLLICRKNDRFPYTSTDWVRPNLAVAIGLRGPQKRTFISAVPPANVRQELMMTSGFPTPWRRGARKTVRGAATAKHRAEGRASKGRGRLLDASLVAE